MNSKTKIGSMLLLTAIMVVGTISMTIPSSFAAPVYCSYEEKYAQNPIAIDYGSYDYSYAKDPYPVDSSYDYSYAKDPYPVDSSYDYSYAKDLCPKTYNGYDDPYEEQYPYAEDSYFEDN